MDRKPDISIVIVNYNVKDFLFQCLKSIEAGKSRFQVQTIVVDNNSEDGSMDYLVPLFPNVEFIPLKDNIGFGRANNLGFDKALGKYVLILNPDTIISNDTLEVMWEYMERDTQCGIAGCKVLNADGTFQLACRRGFPTPWASFSKLFGLQKLFPKSQLFAEYNQTFRSIDETYYIDAVIGAFMFARKEALDQAKGFDPTFFMYGEDLDLCYRVNHNGWSIAYVHATSIVHYKGESTRRSSINEVKHFYEAMEIFVEKHYGKSHLFLAFLKTGIVLRSLVARLSKFKRDFFYIISDIIISNFALLASTKIRFKDYFAFPEYAYPTVFIAISIVVFISMFGVGEYFEEKQSGRKAIFGLMISFFFLSSLTYFFPEYGFSRGVLLMSISFATVFSVLLRAVIGVVTKYGGKGKAKRVLVVGINPESKEIIKSIQSSPTGNIKIAGAVSLDAANISEIEGVPVVGTLSYLSKLITDLKIDEVIMTDKSIQSDKLINILISNADARVRFHSVVEYDDLLAAKIIDEIAGIEPTVSKYNLSIFRNRIAKRGMDIIISALLITIGLPFIALFSKNISKTVNCLIKVFIGKMSLIGLYPIGIMTADLSKIGITGLAHISNPNNLTQEAIKKLNDYYIKHYSLLLDLDILIKYVFRK